MKWARGRALAPRSQAGRLALLLVPERHLARGVGRRRLSAFVKNPATADWSYGLVNLAIYAVGLGLVAFGSRVAAKRWHAAPAPVNLAR